MKRIVHGGLAALLLTVAACGPRQVEVRTAPTQATQISLQVNNNLNQAVNVYVTANGTDTFLRQVGGNSSATMRSRLAAGRSVMFAGSRSRRP